MSSGPATASTNTGLRKSIRRQQRSIEEKRRIVEATLASERSVTEVAQANGVRANQVFKWRRLYRNGRLNSAASAATLLPVRIADVKTERAVTESSKTGLPVCGRSLGAIHIEFPGARVWLEGRADMPTLQAVLEHLAK